jgi:ankyrin repeat protein/superfamily I DNA/RNA helicase
MYFLSLKEYLMSSTVKESTAITITLSKEFCQQFSCEEKTKQKQILGALEKLRDREHSNGLDLEPFEGNQQLYSCRYNEKERLILQRHDDGWYVQQLMDDHRHNRVQTKDINPHQTLSDFLPEVSSSADYSHVEVSPAIDDEHHFFGKFSLTVEQQAVCQARLPIILSGGAGSGKSLILCQRAEELLDIFSDEDQKVLLLTVPRLVSDVSEEWKRRPTHNSRLEICCYADLFGSHVEQEKIEEWLSCDEQKEIPVSLQARIKPQFDIISTCIDQTEYFKREEISEAEKQNFWTLFERYKHSPQYKHSVAHDKIEEWLSGDGRTYIPPSIKSKAIIKQEFDIISACDNQQEYLALGARQSYVELEEEKKSLWALFERYKSSRQYKVDLRYQLFDLAKKFSAVLVDESQIYSHAQLRNIRKLCSGLNFIWAFDNSQNAFGSYSPESFIRSMCRHENFFGLELSSSFRCPKQILDIANQVKEVQHFLVGNQSKQSSSEQSQVSELHLGTVSYMKPDDEFQVENNLHFAVCTPQKFLEEAKRKFPNSLVLLPGEAPGLEFETVLLWRVLEDDAFAKVEKIYRNKQQPAKNRSPVRLDNIEISPLLNNLYVAITRAKSNLVICTQESHNQKIRRLWAAFGLKEPSIASSKLTQQSELAKENIAPNAQETKARIAELRRKGISEEQISRIFGHQSQQKNEPVCAGGGSKARTLKAYKLPQSSGPQPLLELCEAYYQEEHVESIAEVPEDVKKLINLCFRTKVKDPTLLFKRILETCTSARVLEEALKLDINGSTMENFIKADKGRCQSFMMAIHQLDESFFYQDNKYIKLRHWFKQNDAQLNQLIGLMCSDFEFYNGNLSKLISKNAPPSKQNLWEAFQSIKSKLSEYRSKVGVLPQDFQELQTPLCLAIGAGYSELLLALIKIGADLEREVDNLGCTPLMIAIGLKKHHALELLLEKKADVDKVCSNGYTPLIYAIETNNIKALQLLLEKKADVDKGKNDGETPILKAIECKNLQALQLLIDAGANVHQPESNGNNPLHFAVSIKYPDGIKLLLDAKADPNQLCDNMTVIKRAVLNKNTTALELLLNVGANPNILCFNGLSPLIVAIQTNQCIDVDLLLKAGANPDLSFNGLSPLMIAIQNSQPKIVNLLLQANADPNLLSNGVLPIMLAIEKNQVEDLQLLQSARADLNQTDDFGDSPLMYAVKCDHPEAVQLLITGGANVNQQNSQGNTPLGIATGMACLTHHTQVLELLLQAGAAPNLSTEHGVSPLILAIQEQNKVESLELLLKARVKLDQTDDFADSPLMHAVKCDHPEAVKSLIEYGADVNQQNSKGITPLDMAYDLKNNAANMLLMHTTSRTFHF